ncbi:hypothetical protein MRX96_023100 [Rhipicephalus microplus]
MRATNPDFSITKDYRYHQRSPKSGDCEPHRKSGVEVVRRRDDCSRQQVVVQGQLTDHIPSGVNKHARARLYMPGSSQATAVTGRLGLGAQEKNKNTMGTFHATIQHGSRGPRDLH